MKFDQVYGETLDMYELADFLGTDIYGSFFKEHGRFYNFFATEGYVPTFYLELYFRYKNLGTLMGSTHKMDPELTPSNAVDRALKKCAVVAHSGTVFLS